jgi:hypothetical protein
MLLRLIDFLKSQKITAMFTHLTPGGATLESTDVGISSLIDTWLLVRHIEAGGERNRGLYVIKSRGMAHSNQVREFLITSRGVSLQQVYVGPDGVLTGSMRAQQEAKEAAAKLTRRQSIEIRQRELERKRALTRAQIAALEVEIEAAEAEARLQTIGLTLGAEVDVIAYLASKHFGLKSFGALYGGLLSALLIGGALGPLGGSRIYDVTGTYDVALWLAIRLRTRDASGQTSAEYIGVSHLRRHAILPVFGSTALIQPCHLSIGSLVPQPLASPV